MEEWNFVCIICKFIVVNPVNCTKCSTIFCEDCFDDYNKNIPHKSKKDELVCPNEKCKVKNYQVKSKLKVSRAVKKGPKNYKKVKKRMKVKIVKNLAPFAHQQLNWTRYYCSNEIC